MYKCTQLLPFLQALFDDPETAKKAARILAGLLNARSPSLSEIAREMKGGEMANYKAIQRFLGSTDPQAKKSEYVGTTLNNGETRATG
jgi:hypothetical protein